MALRLEDKKTLVAEVNEVAASAESAIAADISRDPTEQLERAARLHQEGVLSNEEFEAMKRKILGGTG